MHEFRPQFAHQIIRVGKFSLLIGRCSEKARELKKPETSPYPGPVNLTCHTKNALLQHDHNICFSMYVSPAIYITFYMSPYHLR